MSRYVAELVETPNEREEFLRLPSILYRGDPNWTPPVLPSERELLSEANPYFANASYSLLLCRHNGEACGRMAIVSDPRMREATGEPLATFGFFDTINDQQAVNALLAQAAHRCLRNGIGILEGPFNPSHYAPSGIQLDRHDLPPSTFQTYNHSTYAALLVRAGLRLTTTATYWRRARQLRGSSAVDGSATTGRYTVKTLSTAEVLDRASEISSLLNASFSSNHRYVPVGEEELAFMATQLLPAVARGAVCVLEFDGEIVGVVLGIADINPEIRRGETPAADDDRADRDTLIIYAIGLHEQHRRTRGAMALMKEADAMMDRYRAVESSWIDDTNEASIAIARRVGMRPLKRYGLFTAAF